MSVRDPRNMVSGKFLRPLFHETNYYFAAKLAEAPAEATTSTLDVS